MEHLKEEFEQIYSLSIRRGEDSATVWNWLIETYYKQLNKPHVSVSLPPDIERVLIVVAKRWGNDYPGSTVGIIGNEAKDILEKHNVDWRQ